MADAALYRKATMTPVVSAGFMGVAQVDPKEIKGDQVKGEYWIKTVASQFARNFDDRFLSKMQSALDGKTIRAEVSALQASPGGTLTPLVETLPGSDKRSPELKIGAANAGRTALAYLLSGDGDLCRRWIVGGLGEVDVVLNPGSYSLYVKQTSEKTDSAPRAMQCKLKVEYKKRYMVSIP
jgi:hypothetical protein